MHQENNQLATKGDLLKLQEATKENFNEFKKEIKSFIKDGFTALDEKIDHVDQRIDSLEEKMDNRFDTLENKMDRRMSVTEDRVHILKNVVEKGFKTKVAW